MLRYIPFVFMLAIAFLTPSLAAAANEPANKTTQAVVDPYAKGEVDPYAKGEMDSSALIDASQRIKQAPTFDISKARDPFVSFLDVMTEKDKQLQIIRQRRQEEARRRIDSRVKEPLEGFDLSSLTFVATFKMGDRIVAMVEDNTGLPYTIKKGDYIGRNNGQIVQISDDHIVIVEKRIDAAGDIVDSKQLLYLKN